MQILVVKITELRFHLEQYNLLSKIIFKYYVSRFQTVVP